MQDAAVAFVEGVIGRDYEPAGLHCWELVRQCQAAVFGRHLPPVLVAPDRMRELIEMMDLRHSYPGYREIGGPQHGAIVFMTRKGNGPSRAACHAGVYLDLDGGGVLHTDAPHGVVFETLIELQARNWADLSFFEPA